MKVKVALLCIALFLSFPAARAELPTSAQKEITHLLAHMENSGCEFNRNGNWYPPSEAAAHVRKKFQYLVRWNLISTTEDFILGAATQSSITHQAYLVRCPGQTEMESARWFDAALRQYRKASPRPPLDQR